MCAANAFMLQMFHEQTRQGAQAEVEPSGTVAPACAREAARATAGAEHKTVSMGVAPGVEHEGASIGG